MPVRIEIDERRLLSEMDMMRPEIMRPMTEEVLNDCNQYCKMDTGALIASSLIHTDFTGGKLVWQTPYARRQYWAIQTAYTDMNPNATWRWAEVAKEHCKDKWTRQLAVLLGGVGVSAQ